MAAPAAPVIRVVNTGSQCFVHWEAVDGATSYDVYNTEPDATVSLLGNTSGTSYVTGPVLYGVVNITVKAKNGDGDSDASNAVQRILRGGDAMHGEHRGRPPGR